MIVNKDKPLETQPRKFLSQEEMSKRRAEGLCYFCDEKFGHYLKHKKSQLFMIEVEEDDATNDEEEELGHEDGGNIAQILVNAIAGISDYKTMKVKGTHRDHFSYSLTWVQHTTFLTRVWLRS